MEGMQRRSERPAPPCGPVSSRICRTRSSSGPSGPGTYASSPAPPDGNYRARCRSAGDTPCVRPSATLLACEARRRSFCCFPLGMSSSGRRLVSISPRTRRSACRSGPACWCPPSSRVASTSAPGIVPTSRSSVPARIRFLRLMSA